MSPQDPNARKFKSQPWILFDSIVAKSFLLGDGSANGLAIGSQTPAVSSQGEVVFFNSSGRTTANYPWYTNVDVSGQLAYGFEVWQLYLMVAFPASPLTNSYDFTAPGTALTQLTVPMTTRLAECFINFGVLEMQLGQENQMRWPLHRFGAGGGVRDNSNATSLATNADPQVGNVLKLPEPIEMPRTENLSAKIRLAAEVFALIGTPTATGGTPGVGSPLAPQPYLVASGDTNALQLQPYMLQLGLVGRRVKKTQYGQIGSGEQG